MMQNLITFWIGQMETFLGFFELRYVVTFVLDLLGSKSQIFFFDKMLNEVSPNYYPFLRNRLTTFQFM